MDRILKWTQRIVQVMTIIGAICAAVQAIKLHTYKRKLQKQADEYLDDELSFEGNMRGQVRVFSPSIEKMQGMFMKLIYITVIGTVISIVLNLINRESNK